MKAELLKKVQPIVDEFIDKLLTESEGVNKTYKDLRLKEVQVENLVRDKEEELKKIKELKDTERKKIDKLKSDLMGEAETHRRKSHEYDCLKTELDTERKEVAKQREKLRTEILVAEDESFRVKDKNKASDDAKARYEKLLKLLKKDVENIEVERAGLKEFEKKLSIRAEELETKQTQLANEATRLNDLDLEVKAREKEARRAIKRYQLKQVIGEEDGD